MENKTKIRQFVITGLLLCALAAAMAPVGAQRNAAGSDGQSLPEVIEAIEKARVTTRILYVTAHPDDEPGAVLAYLARGLHADVALLSLTRGEGGQNALGPEQAPQLGVLRTEELMNATRVYGTRLFFTRAADFGYTKTAEEALKVWGEQTLEDMVRVIRTFRPHVIINNWGGVRSGHGQHQASGILTPQAYAMAGDAKAFPKLMEEGLQPWKAEALLQLSRGNAPAEGFSIPVGEVSALWGKSWGEIGVEGYLNHRTQGVGGVRSSPFFRRSITLVAVEGAKPSGELLAKSIDARLGPLAKNKPDLLVEAQREALEMRWDKVVSALWRAGGGMEAGWVNGSPADRALIQSELRPVCERMDAALAMAAGIRIDAQAERSEVVAGESFTVTVNWVKRGDVPVEIEGASLALPEGWSVTKEEKLQTGGARFTVAIAKDAKTDAKNGEWIYPWPGALVKARLKAKAGEHEFETETEVTATRVTSVSAETRPLLLVPAVTLTVEPQNLVLVSSEPWVVSAPGAKDGRTESKLENRNSKIGGEKSTSEKEPSKNQSGVKPPQSKGAGLKAAPTTEREIVVRVRHYATAAEKITVGIDGPQGWMVSANGGTEEQKGEKTKFENRNSKIGGEAAPERSGLYHKEQTVEFTGAGDQLVRFTVRMPGKIVAGKYELKAYAKRADGEEFRTSLEPLVTLPTRLWRERAVAHVHVMDVTVPKDLRVGYVTAENDQIPQALREIGVHVELLDEQALAFGDLSKYDAICIGIRAYELRSDLARANQRLLDYAAAGGTLVVQYQREGVWNAIKPAPYAAAIGNGLRTTDENSPVRVLEPSHPLLNFPNVIRIEDYSGWVQERGLYYWGTFDAKYTPVLAMKDPGEQEALGALVYARHGKGVYIYTGLSFFRQLPEGVPGAYRLFVNLLSQGMRK
jgi:LmbE family N-acetylglucosaminyl deacetylase